MKMSAVRAISIQFTTVLRKLPIIMLTLNITEIATVREAIAIPVRLVDLSILRGAIRPITEVWLKISEKKRIETAVQTGTMSDAPNNIKNTEIRLSTRLFVGRSIRIKPRPIKTRPERVRNGTILIKYFSSPERRRTLIGLIREASNAGTIAANNAANMPANIPLTMVSGETVKFVTVRVK